MGKRIRVIIADDHSVVRTALARVLGSEPDIEVVGEAMDGQEAMRLAEELAPDVVVMDVGMFPVSGTEATRSITTLHPAVKVVGLSMHDSQWMGRVRCSRREPARTSKRRNRSRGSSPKSEVPLRNKRRQVRRERADLTRRFPRASVRQVP